MVGFAVDEGITLDSFAPIVVRCLFKQFAVSIGLVTNTLSIGQVIESTSAEGTLFLMISLMVSKCVWYHLYVSQTVYENSFALIDFSDYLGFYYYLCIF